MPITQVAFGLTVSAEVAANTDGFIVPYDNPLLDRLRQLPGAVLTGIGVVLYFLFFLLYAVLHEILVTLPVRRHYCDTLSVLGLYSGDDVRQRSRDAFSENEGFAEALDVGAAI